MTDVRVESWIELQEAVFEHSWQESISRFRSHYVFRGVPRVSHALESSLQTGGFVAKEKHLLTSFRKYAARNAVQGDIVWNWLSLAKHHGLPTRLLDWTYSPYVAMHFATHDPRHNEEDAAIWCVDYRKTNELLPDPLKEELLRLDVRIFTTEMIDDVAGSLEALEDEIAKLPHEQVAATVIHDGVGGINESDVMLAAASEAIVIGFNVRPLADARRAAEREGVDVRTYSVIYKITEDLRNAMEGMLEMDLHLEILGRIIPLHRELAARGQVELSTTPFYHPILPLLLDKTPTAEVVPIKGGAKGARKANAEVEIPPAGYDFGANCKPQQFSVQFSLSIYNGETTAVAVGTATPSKPGVPACTE